jgi:hypothetical protein
MNGQDDKFESRLSAELKCLYAGPRARGEDEAILAAARSAGEAAVRGRGWRWRVGVGLAAAVAIAAGVMGVERFGRQARPAAAPSMEAAATPAPNAPTGDIRDAYTVARGLKEGKILGAMWDNNGDGVVDQKDVQALAVAAVRLPVEKGEVR